MDPSGEVPLFQRFRSLTSVSRTPPTTFRSRSRTGSQQACRVRLQRAVEYWMDIGRPPDYGLAKGGFRFGVQGGGLIAHLRSQGGCKSREPTPIFGVL